MAKLEGEFAIGKGVPHIAVSYAGSAHRNRPMLHVDAATFDRTFNVKSHYDVICATVPLMRERRQGSILDIVSAAGAHPGPAWCNDSSGVVI